MILRGAIDIAADAVGRRLCAWDSAVQESDWRTWSGVRFAWAAFPAVEVVCVRRRVLADEREGPVADQE